MAGEPLALISNLAKVLTGAPDPPAALVSHCVRVLGSNIAGGRPLDGARTLASIKACLARGDGSGGSDTARAGIASALRFEELRHELQLRGAVHNETALLALLLALSGNGASASPREAAVPNLFAKTIGGAYADRPPAPPAAPAVAAPPADVVGTATAEPARVPPRPPLTPAAAETEQLLLRDVLYAFQGIDGEHVRYNPTSGRHVIDPGLVVGPATRDLVAQMCELGWLFKRVGAYVDAHNFDTLGLVGQALCASLQDELTDYYRLIAVLEAQLNLAPHGRAAGGGVDDGTTGLTLRRLFVWVQDPLERLQLMALITDSAGALRGGALASCLHAHTRHGDAFVSGFTERMMRQVCTPLFAMISRWVFEGELVDPHGEFFVAVAEGVADEELWSRKYRLNRLMLPRFVGVPLANQILVIGKAINFMRRCCGDTQWVLSAARGRGRASADDSTALEYGRGAELQSLVERVATVTNARLLSLLTQEHELMGHLRALKKFMLLGQGDFVTCLMDTLGSELCSPARDMYRHNLSGVLELALRSSNAQFEPPHILERVGVRLLEASAGDSGWEVFSLDYSIDMPIVAVIHPVASAKYRRLFHLLWRLKRVEWSLSLAWRQNMTAARARLASALPRLSQTLHHCNVVRNEMWHLISNLSSFIFFEVLEPAWVCLLERLKTVSDLDSMIAAHDDYLDVITNRTFLGRDTQPLASHLSSVFELILRFCGVQETLFQDALGELARRRQQEEQIRERTARGEWGVTDTPHAAPRVAGVARITLQKIDSITREYRASVADLLVKLALSTSDAASLLERLNFNGFLDTEGA